MNTNQKKCLMCGGTNLVPYEMASGMVGEYSNYVNSFACVDCGFVCSFADEKRLESIIRRNEDNARRQEQRAELQKELNCLKKEQNRLESVILDENQTVKAVREAKEETIRIGNKIREINVRISQLSSRY